MKKTHTYILLDRSGSMQTSWTEMVNVSKTVAYSSNNSSDADFDLELDDKNT